MPLKEDSRSSPLKENNLKNKFKFKINLANNDILVVITGTLTWKSTAVHLKS